MAICALEFTCLLGQTYLTFSERSLGQKNAMELFAQHSKKKGRAYQPKHGADANKCRPAIPVRQCGSFRYRYIDN